jgi:sugar phosphate isomerase/epimerase
MAEYGRNEADNAPQAACEQPTIALSAPWYTHPDRFAWIAEHGFALEYTPNPEALDLLPKHLDPFLCLGVPVRYHGFLPGYEIGHVEAAVAERALGVHLDVLEAIQGRGNQVITVHIGLRPEDPIQPAVAVEGLTKVVQRGQELGIIVCLENLRRGVTSDSETVVAWARLSGTMLTLDVGHMLSCQQVQSGAIAALDFVDMFADRLVEVHMYEREADRHYPPQDMKFLGPIVERLLATRCSWWTLELDDYAEALATRALLLEYVTSRPSF